MGLSPYLDTSVIVPLFAADALAGRASAWIRTQHHPCIISDFTCLEFTSVMARKHRARDLTEAEVRRAIERFNHWRGAVAQAATVTSTDIERSRGWIARLDITLRAPDAIHLALAHRMGIPVVTFDRGMAAAAPTLSIPVAEP